MLTTASNSLLLSEVITYSNFERDKIETIYKELIKRENVEEDLEDFVDTVLSRNKLKFQAHRLNINYEVDL